MERPAISSPGTALAADWAATWSRLHLDARYYRELYLADGCKWLAPLRMAFSRGLWLLFAQRISHYYQKQTQAGARLHPGLLLAGILSSLGALLGVILTQSEVRGDTELEGGIYLANDGELIFGPEQLGHGSMVHARVTIGMGLLDKRRPRIGRNVWIGPDSLLYGNITIGDGVTILPGTALSKSIPSGVVVQGNPARVIAREADNACLRCSTSTDTHTFTAQLVQQRTGTVGNV